MCLWGTGWRSWLRHYATSRKVAGSIPDGVTGIFHWHNPPGRTMALGLTQPVTEMSTRNISRGYRRPVCRVDNLTHLHVPIVLKSGSLILLEPSGPVQTCNGILVCVCAVYRTCAVDSRSVIKNNVDNTYSYAVRHYRAWITSPHPINSTNISCINVF